MNQASSGSIVRPNVQHAQFGVDPNAARLMQIEARLEQFRRQSPKPKNLLARLSDGQFARPSDLPTYQTLDPMQSASEQLNTSTPVASPATNTNSNPDPKYGVRRPAQMKTPTLKSPGISLESVIMQKRRDREDILTSTKIAAKLVQESRAGNSPFTSKPMSNVTSSPSLSLHSTNYDSCTSMLLPTNTISESASPLLNSFNKKSSSKFTPMRSDWRPPQPTSNNKLDGIASIEEQPITLRSPLSVRPGSSPRLRDVPPAVVVSSPAISTSLHEPQLVSPIPQGSPILEIPSDPEFVPEKFAEVPDSTTPTQHLLPTGRTSRVVQAMQMTNTSPNNSLRTLMDLIASKSSSQLSPTSVLANIAQRDREEAGLISNQLNGNRNGSSLQFGLTATPTEPVNSTSDNSLFSSTNVHLPQQVQNSVNYQNASNGSSEIPVETRKSPVLERSDPVSSAPVSIDISAFKPSSDTVDNPSGQSAESIMEDTTHMQGNVLISSEESFVGQSALLNVEGDSIKTDHHPTSANQPSGPTIASNTAGIELSPAASIGRDDVSRRIITPKRSIALRRSPSPFHSARKQKLESLNGSKNGETESDKKIVGIDSSTSKTLRPLPARESRINSPDDSVRSCDGSFSNRSASGSQPTMTKDGETDNYICLDNWFIEKRGKSFAVFGTAAKTQQKLGGRIIRRHDQSRITIIRDKKVFLGKMDSKAMQNSFGDKTVKAFAHGFPENWQTLLKSESLEPSASSVKDDKSSSTAQHSSANTQPKRGRRSLENGRSARAESVKKTSVKKDKGSAVKDEAPVVTPAAKNTSEGLTDRKPRSAVAVRTISDETARSDRSTVAPSTITADSKKRTPNGRSRPKKEPSTVPKTKSLSQDSNMLLELPLDSVEGVTFSHSGRRRVQPLKFWLTERIIAETGTICTVTGNESPTIKRSKKRSAPKTKPRSTPAKRVRNETRRKST